MNLQTIKVGIVLALILWASLATWAWRSEVSAYAEYKATVEALGKQAEAEAKQEKARTDKILEDVSNAWNAQLPSIRENAIARYRARYPVRVPVACGSEVPGTSDSPESPQATEPAGLDAGFLKDAAETAGLARLCREWVDKIGFPVE